MSRRATGLRLVLAAALAGTGATAQGRGKKPAPTPEQDEVSRLVTALCAQGVSQDRYEAYRRLSTLRNKDAVPLLLKALPDATLYGQNLGISLLQSYPREVSSAALRTLMAGKAPYLAAAAAAWVWRTEDKSVGPRIAEALARAGSSEERGQILGALYAIRDETVQSAVRALLTPEAGIHVLDNALYHLLTAEDQRSRPAAAALLRTAGLPADERALLSAFLLASGDLAAGAEFAAAVESATVGGLQRLPRLLERAPRLDEAAKAALVRVLENASNPAQRAAVARILARHPSARANGALEKLLAGDDVYAARAAFDALVASGGIPREQLAALLTRAPQIALLAADMLRRMDDLQGLSRARELASQPGPERAEAVRVLGRFRTKDAVPPLLSALEDADLAIRTAAIQGLQGLLPDLFPFRRFDLAAWSPTAPEPQRREATARIQAWWQSASRSLP